MAIFSVFNLNGAQKRQNSRRHRGARRLASAATCLVAAASTVCICSESVLFMLPSDSVVRKDTVHPISLQQPLAASGSFSWQGSLAGLRRLSNQQFAVAAATAVAVTVTALAATASSSTNSVEDVFEEVSKELSRCTPLKEELAIVLEEGRLSVSEELQQGDETGLGLFQELLAWLRRRKKFLHSSLGPVAVAMLKKPGVKSEIVIVGTPHGVPDLAKNPVPGAVSKLIERLRPDLVAVELDKARGSNQMQNLAPGLSGKTSMMLPEEDLESFGADLDLPKELGQDFNLMKNVQEEFKKDGIDVHGYVNGLQKIFEHSSRDSLAMNVFALDEFRYMAQDGWGQDATAAVESAAKIRRPVLMCDIPQEWTMSRIVPAYNTAWVNGREKRLRFLADKDRATRFVKAEEKMLREAVVKGHGGDLPALDYGLSLCRPGVGYVEATQRGLWFQERDPVMARAVAAAMEGKMRNADGRTSSSGKPMNRIVLQVGACHVEGIARKLIKEHGYKVVPSPAEKLGGGKVISTSGTVLKSKGFS
eukprot:TRINITY_DN9323_c1_g1_i4.p1 TRINITY_DN9323_c1_g1~~TRINITY_DN9323_c1_g1_i4.p1  ORF type:complete len:544 (+),score=112.97 TRINITY_DN9323_c1_g1_i4:32-1633(+)